MCRHGRPKPSAELEFPAIITPRGSGSSSSAAASLSAAMAEARSLLEECGAVLLRGFGLRSAQQFDSVVAMLGGDEFPYSVGGEATRARVTGRVFTANDGIPLEHPIGFHNEVAYLSNSPSQIAFFCVEAPPPGTGGATPIAHGRRIYERLALDGQQRFLDDLQRKGVRYSKILCASGVGSWSAMYKTTDKLQAEERAQKLGARLEWLPGDRARFYSSACPGIKVDASRGDKVWFNTIHGIQINKKIDPPTSYDASFGDGSPFPREAVEACMRAFELEQVAFSWQQGDVMVIDNTRVLHSRQPCSYRSRTILVSLIK